MGDAKGPVGGVAGEPAADMVVDAPSVELLQGLIRHGQGGLAAGFLPISQQKEQAVAHGEFGGLSEAAALGVVGPLPLGQPRCQQVALWRGDGGLLLAKEG